MSASFEGEKQDMPSDQELADAIAKSTEQMRRFAATLPDSAPLGLPTAPLGPIPLRKRPLIFVKEPWPPWE